MICRALRSMSQQRNDVQRMLGLKVFPEGCCPRFPRSSSPLPSASQSLLSELHQHLGVTFEPVRFAQDLGHECLLDLACVGILPVSGSESVVAGVGLLDLLIVDVVHYGISSWTA